MGFERWIGVVRDGKQLMHEEKMYTNIIKTQRISSGWLFIGRCGQNIVSVALQGGLV